MKIRNQVIRLKVSFYLNITYKVIEYIPYINTDTIQSEEATELTAEKTADFPLPPEWVVVGESVLIRPYNTSGVIGFVGPTHFQVGTFAMKFRSSLKLFFSFITM